MDWTFQKAPKMKPSIDRSGKTWSGNYYTFPKLLKACRGKCKELQGGLVWSRTTLTLTLWKFSTPIMRMSKLPWLCTCRRSFMKVFQLLLVSKKRLKMEYSMWLLIRKSQIGQRRGKDRVKGWRATTSCSIPMGVWAKCFTRRQETTMKSKGLKGTWCCSGTICFPSWLT